MLDAKYYSVKEVSQRFCVGVSTVNKWIRENKLAAIRLGGIWRIPETALEEFIRASSEGVRDKRNR